jgi:hypothetical protein
MKTRMSCSWFHACVCVCVRVYVRVSVFIFYAMYDVDCVVYGDDVSYFSSYRG